MPDHMHSVIWGTREIQTPSLAYCHVNLLRWKKIMTFHSMWNYDKDSQGCNQVETDGSIHVSKFYRYYISSESWSLARLDDIIMVKDI